MSKNAGPATNSNSATAVGGKITQKDLLAFGIFVMTFTPVLWVLLSQPHPTRIQLVITYACIALMFGIGFTLATSSKGSVKLPMFGIALGGGAAIGAAVLIIIVNFLDTSQPTIIFNPTNNDTDFAMLTNTSSNLQARRIEGTQRFLLEFRGSEKRESGSVTFLVVADNKRIPHTFEVDRAGQVIPTRGAE